MDGQGKTVKPGSVPSSGLGFPQQPPVQDLVGLLQSGRFGDLVVQAQSLARRWPQSAPVWHLLGLAHLNLEQFGQAVAPLAQAARLMPKDPEILEQLAIAQCRSGQPEAALRSFERCLALAPAQNSVMINAASLANDLGRFALAERHARAALRRAPGQAEAMFNRGRALRGLGRRADALAVFVDTLAAAPESAPAHNDVGVELLGLGAAAEAARCFRRAIALAPDFAAAHGNLSRVLELEGRSEEAVAACRRAIALQPGLAGAHINLASLLTAQRRFGAAEAACCEALRLDPTLAPGYANLGNALVGQRRHAEAEGAYRHALQLQPDHVDALNNLGNLLQEGKRFDEALACYRRIADDHGEALIQAYHCANHLCDWSHRTADEAALRAMLAKGAARIWPFGLLSLDGQDSAMLLRAAGWQIAERQFGNQLARAPLVGTSPRNHGDRLRIGYLSADFHDHATMHLLGGVLAAHDRTRFALYLYSYGPDIQDRGRQQALATAEVFRDIEPLDDREAATQIAADGIDILVDLKGYTQDNRLGISALRPAPVIVSWLGYPGTLGHPRLADYIIGDPIVTPPQHAARYSETILRLPHCYQPNDRTRPIGECPTRAAAGLPEAGLVFCSFNQSYKITPTMFELWCRILAGVPGSVLWLLTPTPATTENLRREAGRRGIAPNRLIFADAQPAAAHLGRLQLADLALDTAPYGSHTTGSDALWAGVPLITLLGETFASRVAASLLHAVGLPELVAADADAYLALTLELANDAERLQGLKRKLRESRMTAPLFDTEGFARELEAIYLRIGG